MTKTVRIENADSGTSFKVRAHVERKDAEGNWVRAETRNLDNPCNQAELCIHSGQRIVIEEAAPGAPAS